MKPTEQAAKHTPGPWQIIDIGETYAIGDGTTGKRVQVVNENNRAALFLQHDGSAEGEANGLLAISAPELLAKLQSALDLIDGCKACLKPKGNWSNTEDTVIFEIEELLRGLGVEV